MQATPQFTLATALAALLSAAALTAEAQPADEGPQPRVHDGVTVVTGGIGAEEDAAIKRMAGAYPLRIVISGHGGDYYVAQDFRLLRNGEPVVTLPSAGPWVLANLPPGRYAVQGVFDGETQRRAFTLPAGGTTVHWVLPSHLD